MSTELAKREVNAVTLEKVLLGGNLAALTPAERMTYYKAVCESVGLNPLTRPFEYLTLNGKLILYARREATEQLRKIHGVSIGKLEKTFRGDDLYIVEAPATDKDGRTDSSTGAVNIKGLTGDLLANAIMKAETKAKRRVTLSICGLGLPDETEIETIRGAVPLPAETVEVMDDVPAVDVRGDVEDPFEGVPLPAAEPPKSKDFAFLREMEREKKRVGAHSYYKVLGGAGFSHASEIIERAAKVAVFKELQALPAETTAPESLEERKKKLKAQVEEIAKAEQLFGS